MESVKLEIAFYFLPYDTYHARMFILQKAHETRKQQKVHHSVLDSLGQRYVLDLEHLSLVRWKLFPRRLQIELSELLRQLDRLVDYPLQLIVVAQLLVACQIMREVSRLAFCIQ